MAARDRRAAADRAAARRAHPCPERSHTAPPGDRNERARRPRWPAAPSVQVILLLALWRIGALRRRTGPPCTAEAHDPSRREIVAAASGERLVAALLVATMALAGLGFLALFILDPNTQLLALRLGGALLLLAGALSRRRWLVPQETGGRGPPRPSDRASSRGGRRAAARRGRGDHAPAPARRRRRASPGSA